MSKMNSGPSDVDAGTEGTSNASIDGSSGRETVYFDWDDDRRLSTVVVGAVADAAGIDPIEMDRPLYDTLDPDSLDVLFGRRLDGRPRANGRIEFDVAGYAVTVHGEGRLVVTGPRMAPSDGGTAAE